MEGLTTGRIVHYVERGEHLAAMVIDSGNGSGVRVSLNVYRKDGEQVYMPGVPFSDLHTEASWHWPERA